MAWTTPVTKADGVLIAQGDWNAIINNLLAIFPNGDVWVAFTPTLTQGVAVTITIQYARYLVLGKTAIVQVFVTATSSGTSGTRIALASIPAAIAPKQFTSTDARPIGVFVAAGANARVGVASAYSATEFSFIVDNAAPLQWYGNTPSYQVVSTSWLTLQAAYEIA